MDIKSWILLIGSLLIVAVVCHGFWTAYRSRREPFRLDIAPDIPSNDIDDLALLRGELPNGGARTGIHASLAAAQASRVQNNQHSNNQLSIERAVERKAALDRSRSPNATTSRPSQSTLNLEATDQGSADATDAPLLMDLSLIHI